LPLVVMHDWGMGLADHLHESRANRRCRRAGVGAIAVSLGHTDRSLPRGHPVAVQKQPTNRDRSLTVAAQKQPTNRDRSLTVAAQKQLAKRPEGKPSRERERAGKA
jgi:hypothetical protein